MSCQYIPRYVSHTIIILNFFYLCVCVYILPFYNLTLSILIHNLLIIKYISIIIFIHKKLIYCRRGLTIINSTRFQDILKRQRFGLCISISIEVTKFLISLITHFIIILNIEYLNNLNLL